jgi:hypothetical protein
MRLYNATSCTPEATTACLSHQQPLRSSSSSQQHHRPARTTHPLAAAARATTTTTMDDWWNEDRMPFDECRTMSRHTTTKTTPIPDNSNYNCFTKRAASTNPGVRLVNTDTTETTVTSDDDDEDELASVILDDLVVHRFSSIDSFHFDIEPPPPPPPPLLVPRKDKGTTSSNTIQYDDSGDSLPCFEADMWSLTSWSTISTSPAAAAFSPGSPHHHHHHHNEYEDTVVPEVVSVPPTRSSHHYSAAADWDDDDRSREGFTTNRWDGFGTKDFWVPNHTSVTNTTTTTMAAAATSWVAFPSSFCEGKERTTTTTGSNNKRRQPDESRVIRKTAHTSSTDCLGRVLLERDVEMHEPVRSLKQQQQHDELRFTCRVPYKPPMRTSTSSSSRSSTVIHPMPEPVRVFLGYRLQERYMASLPSRK